MSIVVYKCTVCKREIELPQHPKGVETIQRCTITQGCRGKLYQTKILQDFVRGRSTPDVSGLNNWQQRKLLYNHHQGIPNTEWVISHGLGTIPSVSTFIDKSDGTQEEIIPIDIINTNEDQTVVRFDQEYTGIAQVVARSTNPFSLQTSNVKQTQEVSKQLSVNGEMVFAIRRSIDPIAQPITIRVMFNVNNRQVPFEYSATAVPSVNTAWSGVNSVSIRGKPYNVYSFNMLLSTSFDLVIENGATFAFVGYLTSSANSVVDFIGGDCIILLADPPFDSPDKIVDKYIDVTGTNVNNVGGLVFSNREFYATPSIIRSIYPYIKL